MARRPDPPTTPPVVHSRVDDALAMLPSSLCIMSASYERARAAAVVRWAMRCATEPPLVCVSVRKGHGVEPLIRDSRCFALNLVDLGDRLARRTFEREDALRDDPFDALEVCVLATGSPVLARAAAALDCEVVRHFDLEEADHELYVGRVLHAVVNHRGDQA
jgi:flavin reductase (DIM6/NTAB) family NADH-FMN oxidoreductase RutF